MLDSKGLVILETMKLDGLIEYNQYIREWQKKDHVYDSMNVGA